MNPRFTLGLVAVILLGGMAALWLSDRESASPSPAAPSQEPARPGPDLPPQDYVLAVSWHPAFCETKPNLSECRNAEASDHTADHFALHGLWPQDDEYCGVSDSLVAIDRANRWNNLPRVELSDATRRALAELMPGTQDRLERHEWLLHGTCSGVDAELYFKRAIALVEELNSSSVRDLFARNIGKRITAEAVRNAADDELGAGAGRRIRLDCLEDGNRDLAYELRINLDGDVMLSASLAELIQRGRTGGAGCAAGIVDRVGTR